MGWEPNIHNFGGEIYWSSINVGVSELFARINHVEGDYWQNRVGDGNLHEDRKDGKEL
jgi:hypothetical protein